MSGSLTTSKASTRKWTDVEVEDGNASAAAELGAVECDAVLVAAVRKHEVFVEHLTGLELAVRAVSADTNARLQEVQELAVAVANARLEQPRSVGIVLKAHSSSVLPVDPWLAPFLHTS